MATLAELTSFKAALLRALGSGALRVQHGDKTVHYRDVGQLREAMAEIDNQILLASGKQRRRQIRIYSGKGR